MAVWKLHELGRIKEVLRGVLRGREVIESFGSASIPPCG
nr:D159 [uncultured bacterium]